MNLIVVLDALLQEQNVTRAGERVGLSQPAVSNALARLRHLLGDTILERDGRRMRLTERAQLLREPLRQSLSDLKDVLTTPAEFDPLHARFVVRLFASDHVTFLLGPALQCRLSMCAPNAELDIKFTDRSRVADLLENDTIDIGIGRYDNTPGYIRRTTLFCDEHVVLAHRDHQLFSEPLTVERLGSFKRVATSFEGRKYGYLERDLARAGGTLNCGIVMNHLLVAPLLAAEADVFAFTTRRVAMRLERLLPVAWRNIPFDGEPVSIEMIWHERAARDPAQTWFREVVAEVARALD